MSEDNQNKVEEQEVCGGARGGGGAGGGGGSFPGKENEEEQELSSTNEDSGRQSRELLLGTIDLICWRREEVEAMLQGAASSPDWTVIRRDSISLSLSGAIPCNPAIQQLQSQAEVALEQFISDLVGMRTSVTLLLSHHDMGLLEEEDAGRETAAVKLVKIIKVLESLGLWTSDVMDKWMTYYTTRSQLKSAVNLEGLMADMGLPNQEEHPGQDGHAAHVGHAGQDEHINEEEYDSQEEPTGQAGHAGQEEQAGQRDDMCQAIALWDIKMAGETRAMLCTMLFHYLVLEDLLLDASTCVQEQPREQGALNIYI